MLSTQSIQLRSPLVSATMMEPFRDQVPEHRTSQSLSDREDFVPLLNGSSGKTTFKVKDSRRCKIICRYRWAFVMAAFMALVILSELVRLVLYNDNNSNTNTNNNSPERDPASSNPHAHMASLEHRPQALSPVVGSATMTTQKSQSPHKEEWTEDECTTWPINEDGHWNTTTTNPEPKIMLDSHAPPGGWKKPPGIKVVAVIFYGRRRDVDILDCYLQQNLVHNGGYLDEVRFFEHTANQQDLEYLRRLTTEVKGYKSVDSYNCDYSCMWARLIEDNTIYIKIDDDIVSLLNRIRITRKRTNNTRIASSTSTMMPSPSSSTHASRSNTRSPSQPIL